jgi:uncharacterized protein (DUF362 family)
LERERVSLVECRDYYRDSVREAVRRALELLGGAESIAGPGKSVFLKANNVIAAAPDTAVVTHPEVMRALAEEFQSVTDRVTVGDCPGGPFTRAMLKRVYGKTGLAAVAEETGAELALDTGTVEVSFPKGRIIKRLTLCKSMMEADCLVSVSKFKTHRYMNVTGPVKNLYGAIPGTAKFNYHSRFANERDFANLVVDVHLASRPAFHVVDAVEVMQGEGARSGTKRNLGFLAAGRSAFALETLVLQLAGLKPEDSRPLKAAIDRGVCPAESGWFEVLGDDASKLVIDDFQLPSRNFFSERNLAFITERVSRHFTPRPQPIPDLCTGCGRCAEICPRKAITVQMENARVDLKKCIRCFCCEELCEYGAIHIKKPIFARSPRSQPER